MNISTEEPFEYTSEDYKVMTTLATLAAGAISATNRAVCLREVYICLKKY